MQLPSILNNCWSVEEIWKGRFRVWGFKHLNLRAKLKNERPPPPPDAGEPDDDGPVAEVASGDDEDDPPHMVNSNDYSEGEYQADAEEEEEEEIEPPTPEPVRKHARPK